MTSPCIVLCSRLRVKCSACSALPSAINQQHVRFAAAVCRKCFTSIVIDRGCRSSPVVRSCQRSIASVSTASKRRHLLEVLPSLNFTPDTQQVPAKRFSFLLGVTCALAPGTWRSTARVCVCPCVCVRVCPVSNSFFITPRIGTRFVLLTGKHPVVGQLPRVSFAALPRQSRERNAWQLAHYRVLTCQQNKPGPDSWRDEKGV